MTPFIPLFIGTWTPGEIQAAIGQLSSAAIVAFLVYLFARRVPWPRPFRLWFAVVNLGAGLASALLWFALSMAYESLFIDHPLEIRVAERMDEFIFLGLFLYAVVAGIAYSVEATARAARAEAAAARTQLAAMRAQIQPHFLFNALHAVVQLIPTDPARAADAAELVAALLRATVEEERDEVTLEEEWTFVSRYLELEHIRFGDRLRVHADMDSDLLDEEIPSFALQTLVENAVRHGAAQNVAPTDIFITAVGTESDLTLSVRNTGDHLPAGPRTNGAGTGLTRLRERLAFLYGSAARLKYGAVDGGGFEAVVVVPRSFRRNPRHDEPSISRNGPGEVSSESI